MTQKRSTGNLRAVAISQKHKEIFRAQLKTALYFNKKGRTRRRGQSDREEVFHTRRTKGCGMKMTMALKG